MVERRLTWLYWRHLGRTADRSAFGTVDSPHDTTGSADVRALHSAVTDPRIGRTGSAPVDKSGAGTDCR